MSSPLAIDVADLSKKYGQRMALSHANFEVPMGSICGFVGPNGSGKSNILDSICFVLGITNLTQVRAANLQELIYKGGNAGITKATVTITFDNRDRDQSPFGYQDYEEITITRQVIINFKTKTKI